MVACDSFARGRPDVVRRAAIGDGLPLMVIQLVGREPEWIAKGAKLAEEAGADIIDFNMGCPAKEVTGALSGSALMREPELAARLIEAAVERHHPARHLEDAAGLGRAGPQCAGDRGAAERLGVKAITVHGRTRQQFYGGKADWRAVAEVKQAVQHSGDRQWRHHRCCIRPRRAGAIRRRCGDDRARRLWPALDRGRPGPAR